jgi:exonuclease III
MRKLISVNIERDLHYATVIPFLKKENPDVVCLQEVFKEDLCLFEESLGMSSYFVPMALYRRKDESGGVPLCATIGVAILARAPFNSSFSYIYKVPTNEEIPLFKKPVDSLVERNFLNIVLACCDITFQDEDMPYRILTTHFTWTPTGDSTVYQIEDIQELLDQLSLQGAFVLCGDFNAPRGNESFAMIAEKYKDNIPSEYNSSIDPELHRVPGIKYMVDGLFSTPGYGIKEVSLVEGVSDHKAIVASLQRDS